MAKRAPAADQRGLLYVAPAEAKIKAASRRGRLDKAAGPVRRAGTNPQRHPGILICGTNWAPQCGEGQEEALCVLNLLLQPLPNTK